MEQHARTCRRIAPLAGLVLVLGCGEPVGPVDRGPVVRVDLEPTFGRLLEAGDTLTFRAFGVWEDGSREPLTAAWSVGDGSVASVDPSGTVTAVSAGLTSIAASVPGASGVATLLIDPDTVAPSLADIFPDRSRVNVFQRPGAIRIRAEFDDAESGARGALATFNGPLGAGITGIVGLDPLPADSASVPNQPGVTRRAFAGFLQIPANVGVGTWTLAAVRVDDRAGNVRQWGANELEALGLSVEIVAVVVGG
ncbi:MAG: hypothetical protein AAF389_18795 [Gemmatimonadota bacterium]